MDIEVESQGNFSGVTTREMFRRRVATGVAIAVLIVGGVILLSLTANVFLIVFASILLAIALRGISDFISSRTPLSARAALVLVALALLVLIGFGLWLVTPNLATEIDALSEALPQAVGEINQALQQYEWGRQFLAYTPRVGQLLSQGTDVIATITGVATTAISVVGTALVLLFTGFFLALDPELYVNGFLQLVPQARQARVREVLSTSAFKLRQWLLSRFVSMITTGVLAALGLSLLDMPYVLTLSLVEGLSAFVPTIGPIVAAIPALLVALTQNPQLILWIILLYWGIQLIDDYLVTPFVVQRIALLPPVLTLIPQLFMGVLFGLPGVILAAPLTVVIVVLVKMLYVEDILGNRAA